MLILRLVPVFPFFVVNLVPEALASAMNVTAVDAPGGVNELDLAGLEDFVTVLSATTDNVALLDRIRERHGDDPCQWLPVLLREVQDRRFRSSGSTA